MTTERASGHPYRPSKLAFRGVLWFCLAIALSGPLCAQSPLPNGFVYLRKVDPTIRQDIRYASSHNFMGHPAAGYAAAECVLTGRAAAALSEIQKKLAKEGLSLLVWDCYRPRQAVLDFVKWSKDHSAVGMKNEFFPSMDKAALFPGYIAQRSGHSRGSTVDLALIPLDAAGAPFPPVGKDLVSCIAPKGNRYEDLTLDFGTGFDCFDRRAAAASLEVDANARKNRQRLTAVMEAGGFRGYAGEWWHFQLAKEPYPNREFDFPILPRTTE